MSLATAIDAFYGRTPEERRRLVHESIIESHRYHFERNASYRRTVSARGVGPVIDNSQFARILRPASLTFKSYVASVGPFPQNDAPGFLAWLNDQLSEPLSVTDRACALRRRYRSLETMIGHIERLFAERGIEIVTSTGTSGRSSFVARDSLSAHSAVASFFTGAQHAWGIRRGTALVFVMPRETRVAMARIARMGTRLMGWDEDTPVDYTMPFRATPDLLRLRAGRFYRPGWAGVIERRLQRPLMLWAGRHLAESRYVACTIECLNEHVRRGRPLLLLGGPAQLHAVSRRAKIPLPAGSRVATGGGMKDRYAWSSAQIRVDLVASFGGVPVSDVYGMAEANWAAFECASGNHHIPPWVHAVVTDERDKIIDSPDATGMLAFFDPIAGGSLIPPFFQTADRVRLINGGAHHEASIRCACGDDTTYICGRIERADLLEEAGCAAQV